MSISPGLSMGSSRTVTVWRAMPISLPEMGAVINACSAQTTAVLHRLHQWTQRGLCLFCSEKGHFRNGCASALARNRAAVAPFEVFDADPSRGVQFHNSHDPPTHTHHQGLPSRETGTDGDDVIHTPHHPESSVAPETQPQHRWEQAEDPGMVPGVLDVLTITCGATLVESHEGALPANIQPEYMDLSGVFFSEKARCLPFHHS
ncbi:uncharacterized protein LOC109615634 isoform X1 [Esox lucius]|uniref:uncharacterized protein LOC109615634 isoform X1 n=1 Tax=Esox lucius TaxID=8010 RepID=UPI001476A6B1|nr:uncharacterized protein LOC109615634 isoform X1 [Esox lucius]